MRSLRDKKFRKQSGLFVVEGGNIFKDMPDGLSVEYILATEERLDEVQKLIFSTRVCVYVVSESVMKSLSDTVTPYGLIAVLKTPQVEFSMPKGNALLLDGVSDPGNMGTIIRTAAARGFEDIYLLDCVDVYSPKVVRATLGGLFKVRLCEVDESEAIALLDNLNSAVLDFGGEDLTKAEINSPILIVTGSEAHGVRDSVLAHSKRILTLPMTNGIESLNAAVATAVAMYQTKGV
ncbi:MAG: RNA methyltransferase [Clostridia bacterium]|nr:RNA methyltransferase [Clostridia bacterium]